VAYRDGVSRAEAAGSILGPNAARTLRRVKPPEHAAVRPEPPPRPSPAWQQVMGSVVTEAERCLWSKGGRSALEYRHGRGLLDSAIRCFRLEPKPIFRPDVLRFPIARTVPAGAASPGRDKLSKWAAMIATGAINAHKEQEMLGDFLNDVFSGLLGYTRAVDAPGRCIISREKHVQANGKFADT
jgi:hypothetical protein